MWPRNSQTDLMHHYIAAIFPRLLHSTNCNLLHIPTYYYSYMYFYVPGNSNQNAFAPPLIATFVVAMGSIQQLPTISPFWETH